MNHVSGEKGGGASTRKMIAPATTHVAAAYSPVRDIVCDRRKISDTQEQERTGGTRQARRTSDAMWTNLTGTGVSACRYMSADGNTAYRFTAIKGFKDRAVEPGKVREPCSIPLDQCRPCLDASTNNGSIEQWAGNAKCNHLVIYRGLAGPRQVRAVAIRSSMRRVVPPPQQRARGLFESVMATHGQTGSHAQSVALRDGRLRASTSNLQRGQKPLVERGERALCGNQRYKSPNRRL